jgi:hypothetical protein
MEQAGKKNVHNIGTRALARRVLALEKDMTAIRASVLEACTQAKTAADNSAELLAITTAAKGIAGFAKKHGPRIVAFGTGLMAAAGMGNPAVLHFIRSFFGGG